MTAVLRAALLQGALITLTLPRAAGIESSLPSPMRNGNERRGYCARLYSPLLRDHVARAAELLREYLELGQAVAHRQNRLGIIDVDAGRELAAPEWSPQ